MSCYGSEHCSDQQQLSLAEPENKPSKQCLFIFSRVLFSVKENKPTEEPNRPPPCHLNTRPPYSLSLCVMRCAYRWGHMEAFCADVSNSSLVVIPSAVPS
ncbi:hypothetical protein OUZ56_021249 [Daphnia magna]|uniref:Uncharacterized protein n=1 Tax=Daphnia magna TaxID=35525 RepID=A0ABQ9ZGU5_9CRUS|nr:hypothetical protein OUZ56_021249 [Daphnia magna]